MTRFAAVVKLVSVSEAYISDVTSHNILVRHSLNIMNKPLSRTCAPPGMCQNERSELTCRI
jgi:hypothetical protein